MSILKKIQDLENWLINNPEHPDYTTVLKDKNRLYHQFLNQQS